VKSSAAETVEDRTAVETEPRDAEACTRL